MKVLITGAYGFVGNALCVELSKSFFDVRGIVRKVSSSLNCENVEYVSVGNLDKIKDWENILSGYDCVIHCAARAHIFNKINNSIHNYLLTNFKTTKRLAKQSAKFGVKRFIFLSSIGVLGTNTNNQRPFIYSDEPNPIENYAISKLKAEKALLKISKKTGLEIVVIRPPLIYGPSAPGNLKRLTKLVNTKFPLPFSLIKNKRSFIGIDNLVDVVVLCIDHPNAKGKTFLVSDGDDLSTIDFIKKISEVKGFKVYMFPFPLFLLKILSFIISKKKEMDRLTDTLQVDITYSKEMLSWTPRVSVNDGIKKMFSRR